jgi:hypothetical protein
MEVISFAKGKEWYLDASLGHARETREYCTNVTISDEVDTDLIRDVADHLLDSIKTVNGKGKGAFNSFEAEAAIILHRELNLPPKVYSDRRFWIWLSIENFREIIEIRHPAKPTDEGSHKAVNLSLEGNYGLAGAWEGLAFRLWSRGAYAFDPSFDLDPYYHARLGTGDMWRSHIFRVDHGSCVQLSRAFLRECYDETLSQSSAPLNKDIVRAVAKRLRRHHARLSFEIFSQAEAERFVRSEIESVRSGTLL